MVAHKLWYFLVINYVLLIVVDPANELTINGVEVADGGTVYLEFRANSNVEWQRFRYNASNANNFLGATHAGDISSDAQFEYIWESVNSYGMTFRSMAASGDQRIRMKADTFGLKIQVFSTWETGIISFNYNGNTLKNYERGKCLLQINNDEYQGMDCATTTAEARIARPFVSGDTVYLEFRTNSNSVWQRFKYDSSNANSLGVTSNSDGSNDAQFEVIYESNSMTFRSMAVTDDQRIRMKADTFGLRIQVFSSWETDIISFNYNGNTLENVGRSKCLLQFNNNEYQGMDCATTTAEFRMIGFTLIPTSNPTSLPSQTPTESPINLITTPTDGDIVYLEFRIDSNSVWQRFKYDTSNANSLGSTSNSDESNDAQFVVLYESNGMTFKSVAASGNQRIRMKADSFGLRIQGYSSWETDIISFNSNGNTLENYGRSKCLLQINNNEYQGMDCSTTTAEFRMIGSSATLSPSQTPTTSTAPTKTPSKSPTNLLINGFEVTDGGIVYLEFRMDTNSVWQRLKYDASDDNSLGSTDNSDTSDEAKFIYLWDVATGFGMTFKSLVATGDQRIRMKADTFGLKIQVFSSWETSIISFNYYNDNTLINYGRSKCLLQFNNNEYQGIECGSSNAEFRIVPHTPNPTKYPSSNPITSSTDDSTSDSTGDSTTDSTTDSSIDVDPNSSGSNQVYPLLFCWIYVALFFV